MFALCFQFYPTCLCQICNMASFTQDELLQMIRAADAEQGPNPVHSVHSSQSQATSSCWPAVQQLMPNPKHAFASIQSMPLPSPAAFGKHQCSPCNSCMQLCSAMQSFKEGCGLCSTIDQLQKDVNKIKRINWQLRQDKGTAIKQAQVWKDKAGELIDKNNALEDQYQKLGMFMSSPPVDQPPAKSARCPPPPPAPCKARQPRHPPPSWLAATKRARQAGPSKSIHRIVKSVRIKRRRGGTASRKGMQKLFHWHG